MFQKLSFAVLLLALGHIVNGQVVFPGACPEVKVAEGFNVTKLAGEWYQQFSYPSIYGEATKCTHAKYSVIDNKSISIDKKEIIVSTNKLDEVKGIATADAPGTLATRWFREGSETDYNMKVIGYSNDYVVLYSCQPDDMRLDFIWIVTKEQDPSVEILTDAMQHVIDNNLFYILLKRDDQSDCPAVVA